MAPPLENILVCIYLPLPSQRVIYGERGTLLAWVAMMISFILWILALVAFFYHTNDSEVSLIIRNLAYGLIWNWWKCSIETLAWKLYLSNSFYLWQLSPSASRAMNSQCDFLVYDMHDVWHVLSALALFSFFVVSTVIILVGIDNQVCRTRVVKSESESEAIRGALEFESKAITV